MEQKQIRARMDAIRKAQAEAIEAYKKDVKGADAPEIARLQSDCESHGHMFIPQGGIYSNFIKTCAFCNADEPVAHGGWWIVPDMQPKA